MPTSPALLLIADIGGYTRFMQVTRTNLTHSQLLVAQLLEAVIDAGSPPLELAKLEGDAAFFYLVLKDGKLPTPEETEQMLAKMRKAFARALERQQVDNVCTCEGCMNAHELTLKFVAHTGEIAFQKVKNLTELAGVDVIIVHRMLKNDVPLREYVLMTQELKAAAPPSLAPKLEALSHDFEGIGRTETWYSDAAHLPLPAEPPLRPHSWLGRWMRQLPFVVKSLPYYLWKKPVEGMRHMSPETGGVLPRQLTS